MLTDPQEFLRFFFSIHRRTMRDIQALPPEAQNWTPPMGEGEKSWSINQIVHHICESRMYFARAYRNEGWLYDWDVPSTEQQSDWIPALERVLRGVSPSAGRHAGGVAQPADQDDRH